MKVKELMSELATYDPELFIVTPSGDHQFISFYGFSLGKMGVGSGEMYEAYEKDHLTEAYHKLVDVLIVTQ